VATHVKSASGTSALSVLTARCRRGSSQSGLGCGYYLCPHGSGLNVFGGHHGLVSCYVVAWGVSNTLDVGFCLDAFEHALSKQTPEIFNSDQGVQFTSQAWIERVEAAGSAVSMDGQGRVFDNIFIERLIKGFREHV
jgi:hypothetical protein